MSNMNSTGFTNNSKLLALLNDTTTTAAPLPPIDVLMVELGFQPWQAQI